MPYNLETLRSPYSPPMWRQIEEVSDYEISSEGVVRNKRTGVILKPIGERTPNYSLWSPSQHKYFNRSVRVLLISTFPELYAKKLRQPNVPKVDYTTSHEYTPDIVLWRGIKEAPKYEISSKGAVRNIRTDKIVKTNYVRGGFYVMLSVGQGRGKYIQRSVPQLLEEAFPDIYAPFS